MKNRMETLELIRDIVILSICGYLAFNILYGAFHVTDLSGL
jgi:hypothetical protein